MFFVFIKLLGFCYVDFKNKLASFFTRDCSLMREHTTEAVLTIHISKKYVFNCFPRSKSFCVCIRFTRISIIKLKKLCHVIWRYWDCSSVGEHTTEARGVGCSIHPSPILNLTPRCFPRDDLFEAAIHPSPIFS